MRVLIVDDNPADRRAVRRAIQRLATRASRTVEILEAADGGEAVEHLRRRTIDVLICDVRMPVVVGGRRVPSGPAVMREACRAGLRVIAFTDPGLGWTRPLTGDVALLTKGLDIVLGLAVELRDLLGLERRALPALG